MIQPNSTPQPDGPFRPNTSLVPLQKDISAEYHLKLGKTLYQSYLARSRQQDLDAAIKHFQRAVEMEPDLAEAYVQLASALWDQGTINLELAQFYCETALKLDPSQADANLFLGYFLQRAGFLQDAIQQYDTAIKKDFRKSARARIALANALLKQSLETSNRLSQLAQAGKGTWQFMLGCALLPLDKTMCTMLKDALLTDAQIYTLDFVAKGCRQLGMPTMARNIYSLGIRILPREAHFYHLLGDDYLYDLEDPIRAIHYYKQAQIIEPDNLNLLKKLGRAYATAKSNVEAVATLNAAIEIDNTDFDVLYQLAQLHIEQRNFFKSLYYFKEAEKLRPRYPYLHSNMAYVLFQMDDIEGAFEEYKVAMEYGTEPVWLSTIAQTLGTISYQHYKDIDMALDYMQQSLQYNPKNHETLAMLADLYFETGHMEMALSAYKSILRLDPGNSSCYSNIGYILWQLDRNDAAVEAYLTAIHYDKHNQVAYNNLGVIYLDEQNNPEKALPLFETALRLKPDYTLACFNIGRTLELMGRTLEAAEHYSEALQLNQLNPELEDDEIQEHIDHLFD